MTKELADRLGFDRLPEALKDQSPAQSMNLDGRVAMVTGGGGAGLGSAVVDRLASLGAIVAIVDRDLAGAERVGAHAARKWGAKVQAMQCDVTDADAVKATVDECVSQFGALDILVNNVGGGGPRGPLLDNSVEAIENGVRLNLLSQILMTQAALPHMKAAGKGSIICVSSEGGKVGMPGLVVYNSCKAGLIGFVRNLAFEVSEMGVRVNAVCPGIMLVPQMMDRVLSSPEGGPDTYTLESALGRVVMGRGSLPEEVANVVAFLASDAASYVQGAAWSVGGGQEL